MGPSLGGGSAGVPAGDQVIRARTRPRSAGRPGTRGTRRPCRRTVASSGPRGPKRPAVSPRAHCAEDHDAIAVGDDLVDLDFQRAVRQLHRLREEAHHAVVPVVVTRQWAPAGYMPVDVLVEEPENRRDVALGEGLVAVADPLRVLLAHQFGLLLAHCAGGLLSDRPSHNLALPLCVPRRATTIVRMVD